MPNCFINCPCAFAGDIINGPEFTADARVPDPYRLVCVRSAACNKLLRGYRAATGGGARAWGMAL